jgi:hypothetical protein
MPATPITTSLGGNTTQPQKATGTTTIPAKVIQRPLEVDTQPGIKTFPGGPILPPGASFSRGFEAGYGKPPTFVPPSTSGVNPPTYIPPTGGQPEVKPVVSTPTPTTSLAKAQLETQAQYQQNLNYLFSGVGGQQRREQFEKAVSQSGGIPLQEAKDYVETLVTKKEVPTITPKVVPKATTITFEGQGAYGLGGRFVYRDEKGNIIAKEQLQEQALTSEQTAPSLKIGSPSFVYDITPFVLSKISGVVEKIPNYKITGLDLPVEVINYYNPTIAGVTPSSVIKGAVQAAPLFAFEPLIKTGIQGLEVRGFPARATSTYKEIQIPTITPEDLIKTYSKYEITTRISPPEVLVNTQMRRIYGLETENIVLGKPRTITTSTPFFSEVGGTFPIAELATRQKSLSLLRGANELIDLRAAYPESLNPIDARLTRELTLTQEEFQPKVISKDADFFTGEIEKTTFFKGARSTPFSVEEIRAKGFEPYGRTITRARFLAEVKSAPEISTEAFEAYRGKIRFKDVTFPNARASGKIQGMEGISYRLKEPTRVENLLNLNRYEFKDLLLKANLNEVQGTLQQVLPKFKSAILPEVKTTLPALPKVLSKGATVTISNIPTNVIVSLDKSLVETKQLNMPVETSEALRQYGLIREQEMTKQEPIQKEQTREISRLIERASQKEIQKPQERVVERTLQKEQTKQIERLIERQVERIINVPDVPITTEITYPKALPPFIPKKKKVEKRIRRVPIYAVRARKRGRFVPVATGLTRGGALKYGQEFALRDIARTFKIIKTGEQEIGALGEEAFMPSPRLFRTYKVRRGRQIPLTDTFIQRSSANLQSASEREQLRQARLLKKAMRGY